MKRIGLYWNTLRFLRPVQVLGRIAFRLARPRPDTRPHPGRAPIKQSLSYREWREPSLTSPDTACFLGAEGALAVSGDWSNPRCSALWLYNAHYFDDLLARNAGDRRPWHVDLIARWIAQNPPASGIGWAPYPSSLRITNWILWLCRGNDPMEAMVQSLAVQVRYLARRLEHHILGNHLLANAKALVFAGLFFAGKEADEWYRQGMALLERELREQILADGGHFELSPMYHHIILTDMLDLLAIHAVFGRPAPPDWHSLVLRMLGWADVMTHPDGEISLFNDAAFGIAPTLAQLQAYAGVLGISLPSSDPEPLEHLASSGYARLERGGACVLTDIARVGPDYLPAHAHADTLSFELSLGARRVIVNGGTSEYGTGPDRQRQRGTASHSTLMLDATNSSEVWGGFRVARRARIVRAEVAADCDKISVAAEHDGYARLPGRPSHARRWVLTDHDLTIVDSVTGGAEHDIDIFFHLAPEIVAQRRADGAISLHARASNAVVASAMSSAGDHVEIMSSSWHPRFGASIESQCLRIHGRHAVPFEHTLTLSWEPS